MSMHLQCPDGHVWEPTSEQATPDDGVTFCPVCGLLLIQTLPGESTAVSSGVASAATSGTTTVTATLGPRTTAPESQPGEHGHGAADSAAPGGRSVRADGFYDVLEVHARGGLGQVSLAEDLRLKRRVALKELLPTTTDWISQSRFVTEAEITALVEHPGVVPIYTSGTRADQRPFYVMRFIQGRTFRQAIKEYHAAPTTQRFQDLLRRFISVCETIAFAHSKQVLHRDLKPANVMLGEYGETLVLDWGLAKRMSPGAPEEPVRGVSSAPGTATATPAATSSDGLTQAGDILGTPAYMPPEQAAGRLDELGPATDIYALGAMLYEILCGVPPYPGPPGEALKALLAGPPPRPSAIKPRAPRPLESICLKAMARTPSERFAVATDLAREVERFLADEPVHCHPEGLGPKICRWMGRNRTVVLSVTAACLAAALSFASLAGVLKSASDRLEAALERESTARRQEAEAREQAEARAAEAQTARDEAERQRDRARRHYQLARQAVDEFCTRVSESPRLRQHDLEGLRRELLRSAVGFYDRLRTEPSDATPAVEADRGHALLRLAELTINTAPTDDWRQQAHQHTTAAVALFRSLTAANPDDVDLHVGLARANNIHAESLKQLGTEAAAAEAYRAGLAAAATALRLRPNHRLALDVEASLANNLGLMHKRASEYKQAEAYLLRARSNWERLVAEEPATLEYRRHLVLARFNLARLFETLGRPGEAEDAFTAARTLAAEVVAARDAIPEDRHDRALVLASHAHSRLRAGATSAALADLKEALAIWDELARTHPSIEDYLYHLNLYRDTAASALARAGQGAESERLRRQAQAGWRQLSAHRPEVDDYRNQLAASLNNLGQFYRGSGQLAEAQAAYEQARDLWEALARARPEQREFALNLGGVLSNLGHLQRTQGRLETALASYTAARQRLLPLLQAQPADRSVRLSLAMAAWGEAEGRMSQGQDAAAVARWDEAIQWLDDDGQRAEARLRRARALVGAHDPERAAAEVELVLSTSSALLASEVRYAAACTLARAAVEVRHAARLSAARQDELAEKNAAAAVSELDQLNRAGYFTDRAMRATLDQQPELAPLRQRADYRRLFAKP